MNRPYLIIASSDHGQSFDERHPKHAGGFDLNTTTMHVPLVFYAWFLKPAVYKGTVGIIDVLPTLVDLLKIKGKFRFEGTSLLPQLILGRDDPDRYVFSQYYLHERLVKGDDPLAMVGIRNAEYSYVHDRRKAKRYLYQYRKDIHDSNNLIVQLPKITKAFKMIESAWLQKVYEVFDK